MVEGDKVVTCWAARDAHQGEVEDAPPDDDRLNATGITIDRIPDGKIQESWSEEGWSMMGLIFVN